MSDVEDESSITLSSLTINTSSSGDSADSGHEVNASPCSNVVSDATDWQSSLINPIDRLNALLRHASYSDLTVVFPATGKSYKVHRLVLAMSSPVLETLVFGSPSSVLEFDEDVSPQAFKWLLANMYMGCTSFPGVRLASDVLVLAHNYRMYAVCRHCCVYLLHNVSKTDCQYAYHGAMISGDNTLAAKCAQIASGSWSQGYCTAMRYLSRPSLRHLLAQDRLCVAKEVTLYQALLYWGRVRVHENRPACGIRETVDEFLPLVRFLAMTAEEFLDKVSSSGVLAADECVAILMNIRGLTHPLPNTFKCSTDGQRITVFDGDLKQTLSSCPHQLKKSDHSDAHSRFYRQGIGFKLQFSATVHVKRILMSSGYLPRDGQLLLLDSEGRHVMQATDGEFMGHQCTCGKGQNPHSNLVAWNFEPPYLLQGRREYIGKVRHSNNEVQVDHIKETIEGITVTGQVTASPFKIDFFIG